MPIAVTCPKCLTRFSVSEKFAGKKGPCPKCKSELTVPELSEQVVIHAPADAAPKDSKGVSVLKPIKRQDEKIGRGLIIGSVAGVLAALAAAIGVRFAGGVPWPALALAAVVVAPPLVRLGYAITRDAELEPYMGRELWVRVGVISLVLAATWLIHAWVGPYVFDYDRGADMPLVYAGICLLAMLVFGAVAAMAAFDLEFLGGLIIAGMYVSATLSLCLIAGVPVATFGAA